MKQKKRGFTLIELVIVIAVIAILAGVMIAVFANVVKKAEESRELQEAKQAELQQKMEDIAKKLENQNWLSWEDFENELAVQLAEQSTLTSEKISAIITEYLKNSGQGNTGITEEQMLEILNRTLAGQLTKEQVEAIVAKYRDTSSLTSAEVQRIVSAALTNQLTANQIKQLLDEQTTTLETKLQEIIDKNAEAQKTLNEKIDSLSELLNKYLEGNVIEVAPESGSLVTVSQLNAAISRAPNGSTIKPTGNVVVNSGERIEIAADKIISLDFSGITFTVNSTVANHYPILNRGILTITGDSQTVITGGKNCIVNVGTLEIQQVKFVSPSIAAAYPIWTQPNSNTIIRDSEFTGRCGINSVIGNLLVNDCTINTEAFCLYNAGGYVTVNGGTFTNTSSSAYAVYNNVQDYNGTTYSPQTVLNDVEITGAMGAVCATAGQMIINSGIYTGGTYYAVFCDSQSGDASAYINGGTFNSNGNATAVYIGNGNMCVCVIRGGDFKKNVYVNASSAMVSVYGGTFVNDMSAFQK